MKNILKIIFLAVLVSSILSLPVMSYTPFLDQTIEIYNVRARCELCHFGLKLNSYGQDFQKEWDINHDIVKSLRSVENLDSDKDGFLNLAEIKAMSLPGDKTSIPGPNTEFQKGILFIPDKTSLKKSH